MPSRPGLGKMADDPFGNLEIPSVDDVDRFHNRAVARPLHALAGALAPASSRGLASGAVKAEGPQDGRGPTDLRAADIPSVAAPATSSRSRAALPALPVPGARQAGGLADSNPLGIVALAGLSSSQLMDSLKIPSIYQPADAGRRDLSANVANGGVDASSAHAGSGAGSTGGARGLPTTSPASGVAAFAAHTGTGSGGSDARATSAAGVGSKASGEPSARAGTITVNHKQKGNPVLRHVRHVWWEFAAIVPDYVLGKSTCALYISLRYHALHPNYLFKRIKEIKSDYKLRVILVQVSSWRTTAAAGELSCRTCVQRTTTSCNVSCWCSRVDLAVRLFMPAG